MIVTKSYIQFMIKKIGSYKKIGSSYKNINSFYFAYFIYILNQFISFNERLFDKFQDMKSLLTFFI